MINSRSQVPFFRPTNAPLYRSARAVPPERLSLQPRSPPSVAKALLFILGIGLLFLTICAPFILHAIYPDYVPSSSSIIRADLRDPHARNNPLRKQLANFQIDGHDQQKMQTRSVVPLRLENMTIQHVQETSDRDSNGEGPFSNGKLVHPDTQVVPSRLPLSETPALVGASRGHIECDVNVDSLAYWNDPQGSRDIEFTSPFIGESSVSPPVHLVTCDRCTTCYHTRVMCSCNYWWAYIYLLA